MPTSISGTAGVTIGSGAAYTFGDGSTQTSAADPADFGFKNRIINGAMQIAQRATSATITAGSTIAAGYSTVDRFYVYCTGANVTAAQVAGSGAIKNNLQITGAASVTAVGIGQRIEQLNSYDMAGSIATLSVNVSNSLLTTVTWTAYYANTADTFGTLASPTRTQIATGTFTVTSTLTNYSTQISIPAAATTGIEIVFTVGAQTSGTWVIGNVQLEKNPGATGFDIRPYTTELQLCQRYFEMSYDIGTAPATVTTVGILANGGFFNGASSNYGVRVGTQYKVTKRSTPTVTTYDSAGASGKCNFPDTTTGNAMSVTANGMSGFTSETTQVTTTQTRCYWHYTSSAEL